jgi:hypothetical protein
VLLDPPDYTARYNTPLTPDQEAQFQQWAKQAGRQRDLFDYDLRGAWKADAQAAANGHLPDTWKKPNHPTFSSESQYNGVDGVEGGQWVDDGNGHWSFKASEGNVANMGAAELQAYFRQREPDAALILPEPHPGHMMALKRVFQHR